MLNFSPATDRRWTSTQPSTVVGLLPSHRPTPHFRSAADLYWTSAQPSIVVEPLPGLRLDRGQEILSRQRRVVTSVSRALTVAQVYDIPSIRADADLPHSALPHSHATDTRPSPSRLSRFAHPRRAGGRLRLPSSLDLSSAKSRSKSRPPLPSRARRRRKPRPSENNEIPAEFPAEILSPEPATEFRADWSAGNFTSYFPAEIPSVYFRRLNRRRFDGFFNIPTHIPPVISGGYSGGFTAG
ncbi:hypothetical protein IEQ34_003490 [Dendrobium chrysotoxum]|uniref:Uncharacterized protein n=1 Tax=Dendrobium chrysotoxum TaxID=161865 RepID=A0AAV7HJA6_DENCH|nr:hypothetical protein IEQ34_003490 [Dendrobium chrysotoxum]